MWSTNWLSEIVHTVKTSIYQCCLKMKNCAANRKELKPKWMCWLKIQLKKKKNERESILVNRYRCKYFPEPKPGSSQVREP